MIVHGPVRSRRLGLSLGIDNLREPCCPYACSHCRSGRILNLDIERRHFYDPDEVVGAVGRALDARAGRGEPVDYVTFIPKGEATLDADLGKTIRGIKRLGARVAVFTSCAVIWRPDVREDLVDADWVSLQTDATRLNTWLKINRPHPSLHLARILEGMLEFSKSYGGGLFTESFIFRDVNDDPGQTEELGRFISRLHPVKAYLNIPHRPPEEIWVKPPEESDLTRIYRTWSDLLEQVEILAPADGAPNDELGPVEGLVLEEASRRPMSEGQLRQLVERSGGDPAILQELLGKQRLVRLEIGDRDFYLRKLWS